MAQGQSYFTNFLRQPDNSPQDPISNNLVATNPSYPYSSILAAWIAASGAGRILLKSPSSFYYKPSTGSDSNAGTSSSPWASPAPLFSRYDFGGQTVTLNLLENTTVGAAINTPTGGGTLIFDGGGHSIAATSVDAISLNGVVPHFVPQNVTLSSTSQHGLDMNAVGVVSMGAGLSFGSCPSGFQVVAGAASRVDGPFGGSYTITGGAVAHWLAAIGGVLRVESVAITLTGTPAFGVGFAYATRAGTIAGDSNTFSGAATGPRYHVDSNSTIFTNGAGPNYFPGNAAGFNDGTGVYQ